MLQLLRDRVYLRYWLAVVTSFLGDAITRMTVIYLVATATNDPMMIALVIFAQLVPSAALGLFIGPLVDRFPKRLLMVTADLVRIVFSLAMIPARHSVTTLLALVIASGIAKAVFEPARVASIPRIVRHHSIPVAVALFQTTVQTINLVGPMVGGILLAFNNIDVVFMLDAGTFVVSALLLGTLSVLREEQPAQQAQQASYMTALVSGVREVLGIDVLRFLVLFLTPITFLVGLFLTNYNALLLQHFRVSALHFGLLEGTFAVGAIGGALLVPTLFRKRLQPRLVLLVAAALLGTAMVGVWPLEKVSSGLGIATVYVWCTLTGISNGLYHVPLGSTFLQALPAHLRGRGAAFFNALFSTSNIVGVLFGGWLAARMGTGSAIGVGGVLMVGTVLLFWGMKAPASPQAVEASVPR